MAMRVPAPGLRTLNKMNALLVNKLNPEMAIAAKEFVQRPYSQEDMIRMAGSALPWVPGQMGDSQFTSSPEYQAQREDPYLAQLGRVAGFGMAMRGGVGSGPKWMRNPDPGGVRKSITPEMLAAAKTGDEVARANIVDALQNMVAKQAGRFVKQGRPQAEFEDLMAEGNHVILRVLNSGKAGVSDELRQFLPYVEKSISNHLSKFSRGQMRAARRSAPIEAAPSMEDVSARIPDMPRSDINRLLNEAMSSLTPAQREAVELRLGISEAFPNGANIREIAAYLNVNPNAVQNRLKGGMAKLNAEIKRLGLEPKDIVPETQIPPTETGGAVPPISGGSGGVIPKDPKAFIENLGLRYDGSTPGLKPGDPDMHWYSHEIPGVGMTTGVAFDANSWDDLISRFKKPISGSSDAPNPIHNYPADPTWLKQYVKLQEKGGGSYQGPLKEVDAVVGNPPSGFMGPTQEGLASRLIPADLGAIYDSTRIGDEASDAQRFMERMYDTRVGGHPLSPSEVTDWWKYFGDETVPGFSTPAEQIVDPKAIKQGLAGYMGLDWGPDYIENYPRHYRDQLLKKYGKEGGPQQGYSAKRDYFGPTPPEKYKPPRDLPPISGGSDADLPNLPQPQGPLGEGLSGLSRMFEKAGGHVPEVPTPEGFNWHDPYRFLAPLNPQDYWLAKKPGFPRTSEEAFPYPDASPRLPEASSDILRFLDSRPQDTQQLDFRSPEGARRFLEQLYEIYPPEML